MRVLVTGHLGFISTVMVPMLLKSGHEVLGFDSNLFALVTLSPAACRSTSGASLSCSFKVIRGSQSHLRLCNSRVFFPQSKFTGVVEI
jgi:hypothetical protein